MWGDEPSWWYRETPSRIAKLLAPAAKLWGWAAERRYARGEGYRPPIPVVCIGNFTAGGTGKTPLALWVAAELHRLGASPAFLSRGFGGRIAGPHWVVPGVDSARDVGDEPLLLSRVAPTLIARDRAAGARAIVASGRGIGAIVMDDGLQNGGLVKDLVLAVVDGRRGVGNGLVIPAGPLRAPLEFQLALVDAIVVNLQSGARPAENAVAQWLTRRFNGSLLLATTTPAGDVAWLRGTAVLAFSGIGAPDRFFNLLERLGARIVARRAFPDHHAFTDAEARGLSADARRLDARLVTTEKDWVRLAETGTLGVLRASSKVVAVELAFDQRDRDRLSGLIETLLAPRTRE